MNGPAMSDEHMRRHTEGITEGKTETLTISIAGMDCASCALSIEAALKSFKGVKDAKISFASGKATVAYDPNVADIDKIVRVVEATGYKVIKPQMTSPNTLKLKVVGMDNPHCVGIVGGVLNSLPGILSKDLRVNEKAVISYDPSLVSPKKIKDAIKEEGYIPFDEATATADDEQKAREADIRDLRARFFISLVFSVPLFFYMFSPFLPLPAFLMDNMALIEFIFATPIMFAGGIFFQRGLVVFLKNFVANMDTLVALGVSAAYIYSLAASVFIWLGRPVLGHDIYYETAAFLITFILLGKWLEAVAKGRTSDAIRKLLGLQAKTALVIRDTGRWRYRSTRLCPEISLSLNPARRYRSTEQW